MTSLTLDLQVHRYGAEKWLKRFHFRIIDNNICFSYCPCTLFTPREPQVNKMQSNVCNDVHPDEFVPVSFNQRSHSTVFLHIQPPSSPLESMGGPLFYRTSTTNIVMISPPIFMSASFVYLCLTRDHRDTCWMHCTS